MIADATEASLASILKVAAGQVSTLPNTHRAMTKEEYVYAVLRDGIIGGYLAPGTHLRVAEIAEALGTSPIPVRTALRNLGRDELVEIEPHVGSFVTDVPVKALTQLLDIRSVLEQFALDGAIGLVDADSLEKLAMLCDEMDKAVEAHDPRGYARLNTAFHRSIYSACQNETLIDLLGSLELRSERGQAAFIFNKDRMKQSNREHRQIVSALESGGLAAARGLIRDHRQAAQDAIRSSVPTAQDERNHP